MKTIRWGKRKIYIFKCDICNKEMGTKDSLLIKRKTSSFETWDQLKICRYCAADLESCIRQKKEQMMQGAQNENNIKNEE